MDSFDNKHLDENHCFLCGTTLNHSTRSDEHVFPKWLQKANGLWDKKLELLNKTFIPYRSLVIPCCVSCNNGPLARLEDDVSKILLGGFKNPTVDEEFRLFQWCSKIYYGLIYREMTLSLNRADSTSAAIIPRNFMERLSTFHHFMSSIRRPFYFESFLPFSIFVIKTQTFVDPERNFDYSDFLMIRETGSSMAKCLAIRSGEFGVICVFQDNGFQKDHFQKQFDLFDGIPLHPVQFLEFACNAAYKHYLLSFDPSYHSAAVITHPDSEVTVIRANYPSSFIWNDWNMISYGRLFAKCAERFGLNENELNFSDDLLTTWLKDIDGNPMKLIEDENGSWILIPQIPPLKNSQ